MNKIFKKICILVALIIGINPIVSALTWNETKTWVEEKKDNTVGYIRNHKREIAIGLGAGALSSYATYQYMKHRQAPRPWITFNTTYTTKEKFNAFSKKLNNIWKEVICPTILGTAVLFVMALDNNHLQQIQQIQQLYECGICLEERNGNQCTLLHCNHRYCDQCLNTMVDMAIQAQNTHTLVCPHEDCPQRMNNADIRNICDQDNQKVKLTRLKSRGFA